MAGRRTTIYTPSGTSDWDPTRVATPEWNMWEITQMNLKLSLYYAEFQVITADLD
jgi:hypothetical protein